MPPAPLTSNTLARATRALAKRDPDLGTVVARHGAPPLWDRAPGFATLVHIILEQQVSLASALAAFKKLEAALGTVTPHALLTLSDDALRAIGFSRQKARYARELARMLLDGALDLDALAALDDDSARAELTKVPGIGRWTSDIYLLMVLRRPDIMPVGDLALLVALQQIKRLPARPTQDALQKMAEAWRPYRAVAARILWHQYLSVRGTREHSDH
jgi:DNA-3-methyladenine glycosylase II